MLQRERDTDPRLTGSPVQPSSTSRLCSMKTQTSRRDTRKKARVQALAKSKKVEKVQGNLKIIMGGVCSL